jgi:hypothetical protein
MKYIKSLLFWFLDNALAWFTPAWRRSGREAINTLNRYVNYNRHTLPPRNHRNLHQAQGRH